MIPDRTKTSPIHDCRTIENTSFSSTAKQKPMTKPSISPTSVEKRLNKLHQDNQSSLTPMERFIKLSLANDPSPWETKKALKELGFQGGHTRDVDFRLNEAAITAVRGPVQRVGGSSIAVAGSV